MHSLNSRSTCLVIYSTTDAMNPATFDVTMKQKTFAVAIFVFSVFLVQFLHPFTLFAMESQSQITTSPQSNLLPLYMPAIIGGGNPWPDYPDAGNPDGTCQVPAEARAEDSSSPTHTIGNGTAASCTSRAVVSAIAQGGIIRFNCGPRPVVINMQNTAKIYNNTGPEIIIDGGGKVALSGQNVRRILYMNTCDPSLVWTTSHCQNQDHPRVTLQNLIFLNGNSSSETTYDGGGAIWARGGRLKIVNCRFFNNTCASTGPDVGGAAIRAFSQYQNLPLYVVHSTFGGAQHLGNTCSNGGGLSSIGVSYSVYNSLFTHNKAIGYGANPQKPGTPGGGSGGAIYNDGNTFDLNLCGTRIENNSAKEGGGAVFFVSNNRTGQLIIRDSYLSNNPSDGFETSGFPGIFFLGKSPIQVYNSTIQ
jgi:hypothetical protein